MVCTSCFFELDIKLRLENEIVLQYYFCWVWSKEHCVGWRILDLFLPLYQCGNNHFCHEDYITQSLDFISRDCVFKCRYPWLWNSDDVAAYAFDSADSFPKVMWTQQIFFFCISPLAGYALPAVNCVSSSGINAVLEAAAKNKAPVIVQFSSGGSQVRKNIILLQ